MRCGFEAGASDERHLRIVAALETTCILIFAGFMQAILQLAVAWPAPSLRFRTPFRFKVFKVFIVLERCDRPISFTRQCIFQSTDNSRDEFVPFVNLLAQAGEISVSGVLRQKVRGHEVRDLR